MKKIFRIIIRVIDKLNHLENSHYVYICVVIRARVFSIKIFTKK